jgi:glutathione S-transferase
LNLTLAVLFPLLTANTVVCDQDDDGFILFETSAICKYIAKKYANQGESLLPPEGDLKAEALIDQAASIFAASVVPPTMEIFGRYLGPTYGTVLY